VVGVSGLRGLVQGSGKFAYFKLLVGPLGSDCFWGWQWRSHDNSNLFVICSKFISGANPFPAPRGSLFHTLPATDNCTHKMPNTQPRTLRYLCHDVIPTDREGVVEYRISSFYNLISYLILTDFENFESNDFKKYY